MKPIKQLGDQPASVPIIADDVLEFHASRLLLLFRRPLLIPIVLLVSECGEDGGLFFSTLPD